MSLPPWVESARALPLAFALVREDALVDRELVRQRRAEAGDGLAVLQIASGGCTACVLARQPGVAALTLVDANPAQLALARLKLAALELPPTRRSGLFGHAPLEAAERSAGLEALARSAAVDLAALGPAEPIAARGPDRCGRYEETFAALRGALPAVEVTAILSEPEAAARRSSLPGLEPALRAAFEATFDLPALVALFGPDATANRLQPFSAHFLERTRLAISDPGLDAPRNPYLWDVLLGRLPPEASLPWLELPAGPALVRPEQVRGFVADALAARPETSLDYIHLSNVLDWLHPAAARATLAVACARLRPGGLLAVRQLNSTLDLRAAAPPGLRWDEGRAAELLARERSYFYRALFVGRRHAA